MLGTCLRLRAHWRFPLVAMLVLCGRPTSIDAAAPGDGAAARLAKGRELFTREWAPGDERSWPGDGLGPLSNATSCADCHHQGYVGGAGGAQRNVTVLTRLTPLPTALVRRFVASNAAFARDADDAAIHPAFADPLVSSVVLHTMHSSQDYAKWRLDLVDQSTFESPPGVALRDNKHLRFIVRDGATYVLSQRATPALFGAGLIDRVRPETLVEMSERQRKNGTAGRVPFVDVAGTEIGRFGWRGQISSLREFVENACAVELGLQVEGHPQADDPLDPDYVSPGVDMAGEQVADLVAFVASLPPPTRVGADDAMVKRGEKLFAKIGCADCHVQDVGPAKGIYSDLLMHDMGPNLPDTPLPPPRPATTIALASLTTSSNPIAAFVPPTFSPSTFASYYGASGNGSLSSWWRTPPLWGVADSGPYLHDGRAETLDDAVLWHGGDANRVVQRYRKLPKGSRNSIMAFLESMVAPENGTGD